MVASQTMPGCGVWHSLLLAALIHLVGRSNLQDVFFGSHRVQIMRAILPRSCKECVVPFHVEVAGLGQSDCDQILILFSILGMDVETNA